MRILLLIFLACVVVSAQTKRPLPVVQEITEGVVWRQSTGITIANVGFERKVTAGETVTIIALGSGISALDLRIIKAELKANPCDESLPGLWEAELEAVTEKKFIGVPAPGNRRAEYPFDVVILYPAVKFSRQLKTEELKVATLPKGIYLNTIKAAIDLDDDRAPDIVIVSYCCNDKKKTPGECDLTCGKTFKKVRTLWKLVDTAAPC